MTSRYFKVKYGFGKLESTSIQEGGELEKVLYAWQKQIPVTVGDKIIHGKHIISIEPDYNRYTGWLPSYEPKDAEDFKQIKRDCPDFTGIIEEHKQNISKLISSGKENLIGNNVKMLE